MGYESFYQESLLNKFADENVDSSLQYTLPEPSSLNEILTLSDHNKCYQAFVLQDNQKAVLILICNMKFSNGHAAISVCSKCDKNNYAEFMVNHRSSSGLMIPSSSRVISCEHIRNIVSSLFNFNKRWKQKVTEDDIQSLILEIYREGETEEFFINENYSAAILDEYGIFLFRISEGIWQCCSCNRSALKCSHGQLANLPIVKVNEMNKEEEEEENSSLKFIDAHLLTKEKINIDSLQPIFAERMSNQLQFVFKQFNHNSVYEKIPIVPEQSHCKNCNGPLESKLKTPEGIIFLPVIIQCEVSIKFCPNSGCVGYKKQISFSGCSKGYINYNNKIIIGIEIILEYLNLFASSGLPFESFWKSRFSTDTSSLKGNIFDNIDKWNAYKTKIHAAFAITVEQMIFPTEWRKCCSNPKIVSMDGIVASVAKKKLKKYAEPWKLGTVKKKLTVRSKRQLEQLEAKDISLIKASLDKKQLEGNSVEYWGHSKNIVLQLISLCYEKKKRNIYKLDTSTQPFLMFVCKNVASVRSLVPEQIVDLING